MSIVLLVIAKLIQLYIWLIIANALMSWFPGAGQSSLGRWISKVVDPYLNVFSFIKPIGGVDFSPVVAVLALEAAQLRIQRIFIFLGLV